MKHDEASVPSEAFSRIEELIIKSYEDCFMIYVYIIKNEYDELYTGVSENPQQRVRHHNHNQGAHYTKRRGTFVLVFLEEYPSLAHARKREIQIKKWRREKKEKLIELYSLGKETRVNNGND